MPCRTKGGWASRKKPSLSSMHRSCPEGRLVVVMNTLALVAICLEVLAPEPISSTLEAKAGREAPTAHGMVSSRQGLAGFRRLSIAPQVRMPETSRSAAVLPGPRCFSESCRAYSIIDVPPRRSNRPCTSLALQAGCCCRFSARRWRRSGPGPPPGRRPASSRPRAGCGRGPSRDRPVEPPPVSRLPRGAMAWADRPYSWTCRAFLPMVATWRRDVRRGSCVALGWR